MAAEQDPDDYIILQKNCTLFKSTYVCNTPMFTNIKIKELHTVLIVFYTNLFLFSKNIMHHAHITNLTMLVK